MPAKVQDETSFTRIRFTYPGLDSGLPSLLVFCLNTSSFAFSVHPASHPRSSMVPLSFGNMSVKNMVPKIFRRTTVI